MLRRALMTVLALGGVAAAGGPSTMPPPPTVGPALLLRLEGVREPTAAAARAVGFTVASLGFAGLFYDREPRNAEASLKNAIALNPGYLLALSWNETFELVG